MAKESMVCGKRNVQRVLWLALILVIACALRLDGFTERSLWFDEAFTWRIIQYPMADMLDRVASDHSPPLHFAVLKAWVWIAGDSTASLRLPSLAFGLLTVYLGFLVVLECIRAERGIELQTSGPAISGQSAVSREVATTDRSVANDWKQALVAAALIALSSIQIRYSSEARMYSLGTMLALASTWFLLKGLNLTGGGPGSNAAPSKSPGMSANHTRRSGGWFGGFAATALLFLYTHHYAIFTVAGQMAAGVILLAHSSKLNGVKIIHDRRTRMLGIAVGIVALAYVPGLAVLLRQHAAVLDSYWIGVADWTGVLQSAGIAVLQPLFLNEYLQDGANRYVWMGGLWVGLMAWLLVRGRGGARLIAASSLTPIVFAGALALMGAPILHYRYLLFGHVMFLLSLALIAGMFSTALIRAAICALLVVDSAWLHLNYRQTLVLPGRGGLSQAADEILADRQIGDLVICMRPYVFFPMQYYLAPGSCRLLGDNPGRYARWEGRAALTYDDLIDESFWSDQRVRRVWVVSDGFALSKPGVDWSPTKDIEFRESFDGYNGVIRLQLFRRISASSR